MNEKELIAYIAWVETHINEAERHLELLKDRPEYHLIFHELQAAKTYLNAARKTLKVGGKVCPACGRDLRPDGTCPNDIPPGKIVRMSARERDGLK